MKPKTEPQPLLDDSGIFGWHLDQGDTVAGRVVDLEIQRAALKAKCSLLSTAVLALKSRCDRAEADAQRARRNERAISYAGWLLIALQAVLGLLLGGC